MTRAGTLAAAACASTRAACSSVADTITREADSPNSAAAIVQRDISRDVGRIDRRLRADPAAAETAFGQRHRDAAIRAIVRRPNQSVVRQPDQQSLQRAFRDPDRAPAERPAPDRARA